MLKSFLFVCFTVNILVASVPLEKPVVEERIIGGNDTDISKVPYQTAVNAFDFLMGGGFIVSPTHVVTVAEFALGLELNMTVRAGSSCAASGGVRVKVKNIHVHPKFRNKTRDYDVAVIELQTPLKLNDKTIKPIKLATKEPSTGSPALVSGWGAIDEDLNMADTLQSATVPIYDKTKCAALYKPHGVTLTPRMICAGGEGRNHYLGDLGGALAYKGEAVGVAIQGISKDLKTIPGLYINIADPEITKFIKDIAKL